MKNTGDSDDLAAFIRDFETRLERQERHTHIRPVRRVVLPAAPEPEPEPMCIPDVMGSPRWIANTGRGDMAYVPESGYYSPINDEDGMMIWPDAFEGPQSIEVTISNFGLPEWNTVVTSDYVHLECRRGMTANAFIDNDCLRLSIYKFEGATVGSVPYNHRWWIEYDSVGYYYEPEPPPGQSYLAWPFGSGPVTARLESQPDGSYSAWINDTLLISDVVPGQPVGPSRLGFAVETNYSRASGEATYESGVPHISDICMIGEPSTCVTFSDDFERADGPVGSNWVRHPAVVHPDGTPGGVFHIDDGAAVADVDLFSTVMYWHEPSLSGQPQFIEIEVENVLAQYTWISLHVNMSPTAYSSRWVEFEFYDDDELYVRVDGDDTGPLPYPDSEPVRLRLEVDPDGTTRAFVNDTVVLTAADPDPPPGLFVAIELDPNTPQTSPRILSVTGGCLS